MNQRTGSRPGTAPVARQPLHLRAVERHAAWARDFVAVGDLDAAIDEMRDIEALAAEMRNDALEGDSRGWQRD